MYKTTSLVLAIALPIAALAANGLSALVDRVPTLPADARQLTGALPKIEAAVASLSREIEAKQQTIDRDLRASADVSAQASRQQLRSMTGMSDEALDAADDDEIAQRLLGQMGLSMEEAERIAEMDDDEGAAWAARHAAGSKGLSRMTTSASISGADAERLTRLLTEASERSQASSAELERAARAYAELVEQMEQDHRRLNARLDSEMAPKRKAVPMVDCGEEGEFPDARQLHALAVERARAHVTLAPQHLSQASAHLARRRATARDEAVFAERMLLEAKGIAVAEMQARSAQSMALKTMRILLSETAELARKIADWEERKTSLEQNPPKSSCG